MAGSSPRNYSSENTLYLYTSLTAGSSHIITATSRMETILKANRIPFQAIDVATDEKARMLWGRRSKGRKLPGLVRGGMIIGDINEVEEWNEYGELKDVIRSSDVTASASTSAANTPSKPPVGTTQAPAAAQTAAAAPSPTPSSNTKHIEFKGDGASKDTPPSSPKAAETVKKEETPSITMALRQAGAEAAKKAGEMKAEKTAALKASLSKSKDKEDEVPDTSSAASEDQALKKSLEEPASSQITNAPSPESEAIAKAVTEQKEADSTASADERSDGAPASNTGQAPVDGATEAEDMPTITVQPEINTTSTVAGASAPSVVSPIKSAAKDSPLQSLVHSSPTATSAIRSSDSIDVLSIGSRSSADSYSHRGERRVSVDAPRELIAQIESELTIHEDVDGEEEEPPVKKDIRSSSNAKSVKDHATKTPGEDLTVLEPTIAGKSPLETTESNTSVNTGPGSETTSKVDPEVAPSTVPSSEPPSLPPTEKEIETKAKRESEPESEPESGAESGAESDSEPKTTTAPESVPVSTSASAAAPSATPSALSGSESQMKPGNEAEPSSETKTETNKKDQVDDPRKNNYASLYE